MDSAFLVKISMVVVYFIVLFVIGVYASRRISNISDYFVGGKKFGFWLVSFSSRATGESGWLLLGLTGMGFAIGIHALWVVVGEVVFECVAWTFMARRFKVFTDKYDSITIPDYLESRFHDKTHLLRIISGFALVLFVTCYVSAQYSATGKAFEGFLQVDYNTGVMLGFGIVLFYTVAGGFVAVVWSDLFQGILMLLGLIIAPIVALSACGGFTEVMATLKSIDPKLLTLWNTPDGAMSKTALISAIGLVSVGFGFLGSPQLFVRIISVRDKKELVPGALVSVFYTLIADLGAVIAGMAGRALYSGKIMFAAQDPAAFAAHGATLTQGGGAEEQILPFLASDLFAPVMIGVFIAMVLSAIMSTADSLLVVASSAIVRDIYNKLFHPEADDARLTRLSRIVTCLLSLVAVVFALRDVPFLPKRLMEGIQAFVFWFVLFGWAGITASFCPVMILSLFWKQTTKWGAAFGMVTGMVVTVIWKLVPAKALYAIMPFLPPVVTLLGKDPAQIEHLSDAVYEMIPAFFGALILCAIVSLITRRPDEVDEDFRWVESRTPEVWRRK